MEFNQAQHIHKLHIRRLLTLVLISVLIFNTVMPANASSGNFSRSATARKGQSTAPEHAVSQKDATAVDQELQTAPVGVNLKCNSISDGLADLGLCDPDIKPFLSNSFKITGNGYNGKEPNQSIKVVCNASGLQYLRAHYYSPEQGRFITKDPFPGFLSQPSTLNAYAYVTNNPILMNDPSGQIAPLLIAAGLSGLIGAGIDIGRQLYNVQPTSLGEALRCLNWGEVGASFGAGMVSGLTGFTVFGGLTALMGTGFFANVAAGAISGVIAGQYGRLTGLVLSGQISQIGSALFRPQDLVLDAALGGAIAGATLARSIYELVEIFPMSPLRK